MNTTVFSNKKEFLRENKYLILVQIFYFPIHLKFLLHYNNKDFVWKRK